MTVSPVLPPLVRPTAAPAPTRYPWTALLLCLAALIVPAGCFAARQTLWLDETTQLSGLSLGPLQVTRWLAGAPHDFGCPTAPDRMPPLSYWLGQLWSLLLGPGELAQRWLGIACTALAVGLIFETGRRAFGTSAGVVAALLVGLSASIVERAVEIRAYPLYLALAAGAYYAAVRWLLEARRRWLGAMTLAVILTMYAHFYGVVFAVMLLSGLAGAQWRRGGPLRPLLHAGAAIALAGLGLLPFVTASVDVSRYGAHWNLPDKLLALGDLGWSFIGHRILADWPLGPHLAVALFALLLLAAWRARPPRSAITLTLGLTLALGLAFAAGATFLLTVFKPALFQYNLFLVPAAALVLSSGLSHPAPRLRRLAGLSASLVLALHAAAALDLVVHAREVVHGPDPALAATLQRLGPENVTLFHDGGSAGAWVQIYYPITYRLHGTVRQFTYDESKRNFVWVDDPSPDHARLRLDPAAAPTRYALIVRSGGRTTMKWARDQAPFPDGPAAQALRASPRWRLIQHWVYAAGMKMNIAVFEQAAP